MKLVKAGGLNFIDVLSIPDIASWKKMPGC